MLKAVRYSFYLGLSLLVIIGQTAVAQAETRPDISFKCYNSEGKVRSHPLGQDNVSVCRIGDTVWVTGVSLAELTGNAASRQKLKKSVLALDDHQLVGNYGRLTGDGLSFRLVRKQGNADNMAAWRAVLARIHLFEPKVMKIAFAFEGTAEGIGNQDVGIEVASKTRMWVFAIIFLALLAAFLWLVVRKGLLRDPGPEIAGALRPYSLGYSQMAFWLFVLMGSFLYVWLVIGDLAVLTPSVLLLIGISATTALAAVTIGGPKGKDPSLAQAQEREELKTQLLKLQGQINTTTDVSTLAQLKADYDLKQKGLTKAGASSQQAIAEQGSRGFWLDILSSGREVLLPRFQMMAWTLVLGLIFIHSVFTTLTMPEFDANLLALMGISSGTYVGFKFPSKTGK